MRLLKLEIKRVLKTRVTFVLLLTSFLLSFLLAYLPTTFPYIKYTDASGNIVELKGAGYEKALQADIAGTVSPEKIRQAVEDYQACLKKYGVENSYDLPDGVYETEILPYAPLLHGVREVYADPDTGIAASLTELEPEALDNFYEKCGERIVSLMKQEQKGHEAAQAKAVSMYLEVEKPFRFFPGYSSDPMDYQIILAFFILLFCAVITAPVFTSDYQTGADDILRCTKYGRAKFALTKILSALLICGTVFALCSAIYLFVSNSLFGWECTETSMQMIYSAVNLPDMNIGQLQRFAALGGLLCLLATVSFTLFLSSKFKNVVASLAVALLFCILPIIIYMAFPTNIGNWIYPLLPASGAGLQTSFLYTALEFDFWNIGDLALWIPHVMLIVYSIEIPLFILLAVWSYTKHMD